MVKRKLQVFISSTYIDLKDERQAAVEAILSAGHIPAGMELFKAGNKSQLETIKKWINQSDVYMLILGGRYGSIEESTKKSYTQIEYEYALNMGIPLFAVVLSDSYIEKKISENETIFKDKEQYESSYSEFKKTVESKMVKFVNDLKDIRVAILESLGELEKEYAFEGWIRGNAITQWPFIDINNDEIDVHVLKNCICQLQDKLTLQRVKDAHSVLEHDYPIRGLTTYSHKIERIGTIKLSDIFCDIASWMGQGPRTRMRLIRKVRQSVFSWIDRAPGDKVKKIYNDDILQIITKLYYIDVLDKTNIDWGVMQVSGYSISDLGIRILQNYN